MGIRVGRVVRGRRMAELRLCVEKGAERSEVRAGYRKFDDTGLLSENVRDELGWKLRRQWLAWS
jgi:hypothetical protein